MFGKKQHISKNIKRVDAIVTGLILGGVVASIYGLSKEKKEGGILDEKSETRLSFGKIVKLLVFGVPKEKMTMWQKVKGFFKKK